MEVCVVFLFCFVRGGGDEEGEEEEERKRHRRCRTKRPCGHASLALGLSIGHETFCGSSFVAPSWHSLPSSAEYVVVEEVPHNSCCQGDVGGSAPGFQGGVLCVRESGLVLRMGGCAIARRKISTRKALKRAVYVRHLLE